MRDPKWRRCFIRPSSTARSFGTTQWSSRARPSSPCRAATVSSSTSVHSHTRITQIVGRSRDGRDAPRAPDVAPPRARPDHPPEHLVSCHDAAGICCILQKDASDIIAGRFPKYGVLPNVYGSPATWNADLTIVSSMNMALHVGAEVILRTLGTRSTDVSWRILQDWSRGVLENFLTHGMRWVLPTQVQLVA